MSNFTFPLGVGAGFYANIVNYSIHDNGGSPYRVQVNEGDSTATVFMQIIAPDEDEKGYNKKTDSLYSSVESFTPNKNYRQREKYLTTFKFSSIWIGVEPTKPQWMGNTILLKVIETDTEQLIKPKYVLIGNRGIEIVDIPDDEEIYILFSPIGNNDVPYEYAVGRNRIYLFEESISMPTNQVPLSLILSATTTNNGDIYDEYYRCSVKINDKSKNKINNKKHKNCEYIKMKPNIEIADRDCPWNGSCKKPNFSDVK